MKCSYKIDESWNHYTKWKKPLIKGHILCDMISLKCLEETNLYREEVDEQLPRIEGRNVAANEYGFGRVC